MSNYLVRGWAGGQFHYSVEASDPQAAVDLGGNYDYSRLDVYDEYGEIVLTVERKPMTDTTKAMTIKDAGMPIAADRISRKWWAVLKTNAGWQGPYDSLERAQQEAARLLARDAGWEQYHVVELVGTVMKPIPDMTWHEPEPKSTPPGAPGNET